MITLLPQSYENNLAFEVTGTVTLEEEQAFLKSLDEVLEKYDKLNTMIILGEDAKWGLDAGRANLKWLIRHMDNFNRIAIVSNSTTWKVLVTIDSFFAKFIDIHEKYFDAKDVTEAWEWVSRHL